MGDKLTKGVTNHNFPLLLFTWVAKGAENSAPFAYSDALFSSCDIPILKPEYIQFSRLHFYSGPISPMVELTESAIFISERRRPALRRFLQSPALRRFLQFVILIYNLPISIYYALQLRTPLSLLVCALLTAANIAMFRMGAAIEAGRSQLMLYYKLLAIGLTLVGLFGLLQRYCHCA